MSNLECPVCLMHYAETDPTTFPCGHSCCLIDAQELKKCCFCGEKLPDASKMVVNFTLRDIAKEMASHEALLKTALANKTIGGSPSEKQGSSKDDTGTKQNEVMRSALETKPIEVLLGQHVSELRLNDTIMFNPDLLTRLNVTDQANMMNSVRTPQNTRFTKLMNLVLLSFGQKDGKPIEGSCLLMNKMSPGRNRNLILNLVKIHPIYMYKHKFSLVFMFEMGFKINYQSTEEFLSDDQNLTTTFAMLNCSEAEIDYLLIFLRANNALLASEYIASFGEKHKCVSFEPSFIFKNLGPTSEEDGAFITQLAEDDIKRCGYNTGPYDCTEDPHLVCSKCKNIHYCSKAHQIAHWKVHKQKCCV